MGLFVLGAGGHAKVVIATLEAAGFDIAGVLDDTVERHGSLVLGRKILGSIASESGKGHSGVIAVGSNKGRKNIATTHSFTWLSVVHPAATVHTSVKVGPGTVIFAGAMVQPEARLGSHVILNTACSVDHDCQIADFCHVAPGARLAGGVTLDEGCLVGIGAAVLPRLTMGSWSILGGGAALVRDLPSRVTAVGLPARIIKRKND